MSGGTTNFVTVKSGKSVENKILMNCVVKLLVILQIAKECKYYKDYKRCKFNPCKFLHTVSKPMRNLKNLVRK